MDAQSHRGSYARPMTDGVAAAISRLRRVPLREVWRHAAYDFATWLEDNTDVLSEVLGITIENVERERAAGSLVSIWSERTGPATRS
jgi:hypothetical protein